MTDEGKSNEATRPASKDRLQRAIRRIGVILIRLIYHVRVVHPDRLPQTGGALLLPNHGTFADAFFISAACPRPVRFVMEEAFMAKPAIRHFVSLFNTVTINQAKPREAIRIIIEALQNGELVCLFPEGQITRTGTMCALRRGCELIARKAGHPLLPMYVDGSWGSIFSYERNQFFRKLPYRIPFPLHVAFGEAFAPEHVDLTEVRNEIFHAAADAMASRFPHATPVILNGYQIGNVNALPRREKFHVLAGDLAPDRLAGLLAGFGECFGSYPEWHESVPDDAQGNWVGAEKLRGHFKERRSTTNVVFYDFSEISRSPLVAENVQHFPCLAIDGQVISMSMKHPAQTSHSELQTGHKPNTFGKLLPGWYLVKSGTQQKLQGPSPAQAINFPTGLTIDEEGFVG